MFWGFRLIYLFILFLSTFSSFFFSSSLSIWLLLELNFMCFVSILSQEFSVINSNGNLYYFLIQSFGSAFMLLSILVFMMWENKIFKLIFLMALMLKLGSAPFQFWYLKLIQKINWSNIWLLSIWQKLIPLILLKFSSSKFILFFGIFSVVASSTSSIKQKKIKKILGLSSLFSLGWVLSIVSISKIWGWFMLGYSIALLNLIYCLKKTHSLNVEILENSLLSPMNLIVFFLSLLMMSGIPPFIVFYLKIFVLSILMKVSILLMILFLLMSVFMIYIYLMMMFSMLTFMKLKVKSDMTNQMNFSMTNILFQNLVFSLFLIAFM